MGITEIAEHYSISGNESLSGVSLGVGKIVKKATLPSKITINVYSGESLPGQLLSSKEVAINNLVADAMNFIDFDQDVQPSGA